MSIAHPYEASAVSRNRTAVTMLDSTGALRQQIRDVFAEWAVEDSTMARVTRATDDSARLQLLRAYIRGIPKTNVVVARWVADTRLVLDNLRRAGPLGRAIDPERIGVFGHSMGGVVAGEFCLRDARCRAGLNLDGSPQSGTMIDDRTTRKPFMMVYSARPGRLGANDAIYARAAKPYYRVDVADTRTSTSAI